MKFLGNFTYAFLTLTVYKTKYFKEQCPKKSIFDTFIYFTEKFTVKSAEIKIPHDFNGEFPIIFSPDQPLKVPIIGKIPHF